MRRLLGHINVINIILTVFVIALAKLTFFPFLHADIKFTPAPREKTTAVQSTDTITAAQPSPSDYLIIPEENLFHPERKIPPEKKAEQELPKPDFVLYGTIVSDDFSMVFLEDLQAPRSTPGRGRRQMALKKGDALSGFRLAEVHADRITMVRGEESMTVAVFDPRRPKERPTEAPDVQRAPQKAPAQAPSAVKQQKPAEKRRASSQVPEQPPAQVQSIPGVPLPPTEADARIIEFMDRQKQGIQARQ